MTNRSRTALACATLTGAVALPAAAEAASFTALKPCYVSLPAVQEPIKLAGTGFTPGSKVDIAVDGITRVFGAPVDAAGNLTGDPLAGAPPIAQREKSFQITATEQGAAAPAATATAKVTALNVGVQPRRARPSSKVRFRGRGFTAPGKVYAHYRYKGKTRKTVTFNPKGACGKFSVRKRQIPVRRPGTGEWTVQFSQQKRYARTPAGVFVRLKILVTRTIRF